MKKTLVWQTLWAVVIALAAVVGASTEASADRGNPAPGRGRQPLAIAGVIGAIEANDDGSLLTLQRTGQDDVLVQVTEETRIVPAGATPEVGDHARVVGEKPENEGDPVVAAVLTVAPVRTPVEPPAQRPRAVLSVCGTITALPDDIHDGTWTVAVAGIGEYDLVVNAETDIVPPDAAPEIGDPVCARARQTDEGWLALHIQLEWPSTPRERRQEHRAVVVRGTVAGLPEDRSGDWALVVAVANAGEQSIGVTPATKVTGELAVGVKVVVVARKVIDSAGNESLVAVAIQVVERREPAKPGQAVRLKGVVKEVGDAAWTITQEDGSDVVVGITEDTTIVGLAEGEDPTGRKVQGVAHKTADGALVARMLRLEKD